MNAADESLDDYASNVAICQNALREWHVKQFVVEKNIPGLEYNS